MGIVDILKILVVGISVLLIVVIVLQPKEGDAGTLFGGGFGDDVKRTKRGSELFLHNASIILSVFWIALSIAIMLLAS